MTSKNIIRACLLSLLLAGMPSLCLAYNLMAAKDLKTRLDAKQPTILVDIQTKNAYNEHHFYGAVRTYAYPAKTDAETDSLVQAVRLFQSTGHDVVIIGPRGGKAEERSLDFLVSRGIPENKMSILKGGIDAWPYQDLLLNLKGGCY